MTATEGVEAAARAADPGSGEADVVGLPSTGAGTGTTAQPLLILFLGALVIATVAGAAFRRRSVAVDRHRRN